MQKKIGVLIGRFQLPRLHDGHKAFIRHILAENDDVCVLVGVSPTTTAKNPLPFDAVAQLVRNAFPQIFHVHPLLDVPGEDLQWSLQIDRFLALLFPGCKMTLYSGRDSIKPHYEGRFRPVTDWYGYDGNVNASRVRQEIANGKPLDCDEFRKGIIYGILNYIENYEYQHVIEPWKG